MKADMGDFIAYQYAEIHAQWGERSEGHGMARDGLPAARSGLSGLKVDELLDPLRKERAFERSSTNSGFRRERGPDGLPAPQTGSPARTRRNLRRLSTSSLFK